MSVYVSSLIWRHFPDGGGAMLTALALADIADDQGRCVYDDASAAAIALKTQQGSRTVGYHFSAMRESGWLEITSNPKGGRGNKISVRIPVERIPMTSTGRLQKLQALVDNQPTLDDTTQSLVDTQPKSLQKMQGSQKAAINDKKPATGDTKGCKTEHPPNIGYVVHKNTGTAPCGADPFERFWQAWPRTERKVSKSKCLAVWRRKKLDGQIDVILRHVEACKKSESWRTGYEPMPLTYLNQERWDGADLQAPASGEKPWFINGWSGIVAKGAEHGLQEQDYRTPPEFRAAVLKLAGVTSEQVRQAEAEWGR